MTTKTKEQKYQAILDHAKDLDAKGKTEKFADVAKFLNRSGFRNNSGQLYSANPRGVARVISQAYVYAKEKFGEKKALPICNAFTGMSGAYAWSDE